MDRLIDEYPYDGLPIGNRYSPMLANLYLSDLDHYLKEQKHVHYLISFMDDRCILGYSKQWLHRICEDSKTFLEEKGLKMKGNYQVFPIHKRPIRFLGHVVYPTHILLAKYTKQRIKRATNSFKEWYADSSLELSPTQQGTIASYHGVLKWCNGKHLEKCTIGPIYEEFQKRKNVNLIKSD